MADEKQADPHKLKIDNVRLSFPDIFEPRAVKKGDTPKYSAHFILDKKEHEDLIKVIRGGIWGAAKEKWGDEAKKIVQGKKFEKCLHDGEEKEDMAGYGAEVMYLSTSSNKRPLVIDRDRTPLTRDDRRPYGGCYVNAIVRFWVQDNDFGKRVNAELMGVQFFKDGEPFGAFTSVAPDDFEDFGGGKAKDKAPAGDDGDEEIPV